MTNEPHNWSQIVEKLRHAAGLAPPSRDEADAAMASAGEISMSQEQIRDIARKATTGVETRPELEPAMQDLVDQPIRVLLRGQGGKPGESGVDAADRPAVFGDALLWQPENGRGVELQPQTDSAIDGERNRKPVEVSWFRSKWRSGEKDG